MKRRVVVRVGGAGHRVATSPPATPEPPPRPVPATTSRGTRKFHAAWHRDGRGATFYVSGEQVMCTPDPEIQDNLVETVQLKAARAELVDSLDLAVPATGDQNRTNFLRDVTRRGGILADFVWDPPLPEPDEDGDDEEGPADLEDDALEDDAVEDDDVMEDDDAQEVPVLAAVASDVLIDADEHTINQLMLGYELERADREGFRSDAVLPRAAHVRDRVIDVVGWEHVVTAFLGCSRDRPDESVESMVERALDASGYRDARECLFPKLLPPPRS